MARDVTQDDLAYHLVGENGLRCNARRSCVPSCRWKWFEM